MTAAPSAAACSRRAPLGCAGKDVTRCVLVPEEGTTESLVAALLTTVPVVVLVSMRKVLTVTEKSRTDSYIILLRNYPDTWACLAIVVPLRRPRRRRCCDPSDKCHAAPRARPMARNGSPNDCALPILLESSAKMSRCRPSQPCRRRVRTIASLSFTKPLGRYVSWSPLQWFAMV